MHKIVQKIKLWIQEHLRLLIHKFPRLYRLCLSFISSYGKWYYDRLDKKYHYRKKLQNMKGSKFGKRCFIIGNGPSLTVKDLGKLVNEDCFAANQIYKIFPYTKWRPLFYTIVDWHALGNTESDIFEAGTFFFGDYFWRKNHPKQSNAIVFYGKRLLDTDLASFKFSEDIAEQIYLAATVTYASLQIAVYLGYTEIYLLGVDHNYAFVTDRTGKVIRNSEAKQSHFFEDKDPTKVYADELGMTNAYITAKQHADAHGINIYNATRGGKLEVFTRVDFDSLFQS